MIASDRLVIDIGKTNSKLIRFDDALQLLWEVKIPTPRIADPYPALDLSALEAWLRQALAALPQPERIGHIMPITHGAAFALVGKEDALALPVLDYETPIPVDVSARYELIRPDFSESGSPAMAAGLNAGRQLFWLKEAFPAAWQSTTSILPLPQYLALRLSGHRCSEVSSLGCHTDLWAPWSGDFTAMAWELGIAQKIPPRLVAGARAGQLTPDWAAATGLHQNVAVHVGAHDSSADLVPHLICKPQTIILSTGTWAVAMAPGGRADIFAHVADQSVNVTVDGRALPTARSMAGRLYEDACKSHGAVQAAKLMAAEVATLLAPISAPHDIIVTGAYTTNAVFMDVLSKILIQHHVQSAQHEAGAAYGAAKLIDSI
jgi:sugar (pentulose or hexulose) kinase